MNRLVNLDKYLIANTLENNFDLYRKSSTIDKDEFNKTVFGSNYKERLRVFDLINKKPELFCHYHLDQKERSQQRKDVNRVIFNIKEDLGVFENAATHPNKLTLASNGLTFYDLNIITKLGVHYSLYIKTIEKLGTQKHKIFYDNACKFKDIGCFALTQIFHGSNVKSSLTEAHYDHQSKEFIINSPSKEAMKFWIGGAAKTSNMSIVWAQLYIKERCYGLHAFVVPLRCTKTHKVLPGITIGDCGPKFGLNAVDNGFILFDKFRIPAENLLNKVSGVNKKGQFFSTIQGQSKRFGLTISALSEGRLFTCCHGSSMGLSALTIALRYTFVRRQFTKKDQKDQKEEVLLIDYPLTRRRMVPLLAQQIIYMCVTMSTFQETQSLQEKNILSNTNPFLQEIHAISSVLKAKTTWFSTEAVRQSRQMMGGHGYSAYSKMGVLYSNNDVNNTWQGDNAVIAQQTTKYVLENFGKAMKGKPIKSALLQFLASPPVEQQFKMTKQWLLNFSKIEEHLQKKIYNKTQQMAFKMMELKDNKMNSTQIWNSTQLFLGQAIAITTGDLYILKRSVKKMNEIKDPKTKLVFKDILHLWALVLLKNDEAFSEQHHEIIQGLIMQYSHKLTSEILGLLEAVSANENVLGTPFADENGKGFEKYVSFVLQQIKQHNYKAL